MTLKQFTEKVVALAARRTFDIDPADARLAECFTAGLDPDDTVDGFIQEACDWHSLNSRAPLR